MRCNSDLNSATDAGFSTFCYSQHQREEVSFVGLFSLANRQQIVDKRLRYQVYECTHKRRS